MMSERPVIICLTPVRNEAWILDAFLKCTSLWADHIIIADQNSTDGSRDIALRYPKVILIDNDSTGYDEYARQLILLEAARKIPGKRLLITLDADEFFTADYAHSGDWKRMLNGNPGDSFGFRWVNIKPGFKKYWSSEHYPWAFIDDNSVHAGKLIHSPRLPLSPGKGTMNLDEISVLHYQYANWSRMESKHRYYQCLERINFPSKSAIGIYRMYHHMYAVREKDCSFLKEDWFRNYELQGIEVRNIKLGSLYWFDEAVLKMLDTYGVSKFRKEAIWDIDWNAAAGAFGMSNDKKYNDPRNLFERLLHSWLKITRSNSRSSIVARGDSLINQAMLKFNILRNK